MTTEKPNDKSEEKPSESDRLFQDMSEIIPRRNIELPKEVVSGNKGDGGGDGEHDTLEERIEYSPKLTDMQVADRRLNPDLGYPHLNVIQMSRVFPDVYNSLFRIQVKHLIRHSLIHSDKKLSVAEAIAKVNTALSIGIDGEGRIDEIKILGKAVEQSENKDKNLAGM